MSSLVNSLNTAADFEAWVVTPEGIETVQRMERNLGWQGRRGWSPLSIRIAMEIARKDLAGTYKGSEGPTGRGKGKGRKRLGAFPNAFAPYFARLFQRVKPGWRGDIETSLLGTPWTPPWEVVGPVLDALGGGP